MVNEFVDYLLNERNRSTLTGESYASDLREFEAYFKAVDSGLTWQTVDADIIRDWMEQLMDKGMQPTAVSRKLSALRSFYRWALSRKRVEKDPTRTVKSPKLRKPLPHFLRETEMDRLIDLVEWGSTYEDERDKAIIMTFYETGIRVSELTGLDDDDIDFTNRQLKVTGKGNKQRYIPFGEELAEALHHYLYVRDADVDAEDDALFLTARGKRMHRVAVGKLVKERLSAVSSQKKLSPHVLRHTFATAMLNHGASIESVRRLLGHASVSTTEIYTHTTFEQLKRVYKDAHPRA